MALVLFENTFVLEPTPYLATQPEWSLASSGDKERVLSTASFKLNDQPWLSAALSTIQPLAWPRETFSFFHPVLGLWLSVEQGTVPYLLEEIVCRLALHYLKYPSALSDYSVTYDSISVGPISVSNNDAERTPSRPPAVPLAITSSLAPLLRGGGVASNSWWRAN